MAEQTIELTDEILGAYADGELDAHQAAQVERAAALDPAARRRLAAIREVTTLVRAARTAGNPDVAPAPERSGRRRTRGLVAGRLGWLNWQLAASFAAGALVLLIAIELAGGPAPAGADWREHAMAFQDMYLRARETERGDAMVDILANHSGDLARLISFEPSLPDLSAHGYDAVAAHLLSAPHGPVVYVAFEGVRRPPIAFVMTRRGESPAIQNDAAPAVHSGTNGVTLVSWARGAYEFGLSGRVPAAELMALVDTARGSLHTENL
jgi:anti-sigma factor RsiW